ncbi:MAG: hypothetical protein FJ363_00430 [Gemmatimonadetes bacterium]|nr:hypothetical protein [Gemmatimonadota bacterium]
MTRSERIENTTAVVIMAGVAAAFWKPEWEWLNRAILAAIFVGLGWAYAVRTPEDRVRAQRGVWVIPVVATLMAAQWIYFAEPEGRVTMTLLGAGLVAAASALAFLRRRRQ